MWQMGVRIKFCHTGRRSDEGVGSPEQRGDGEGEGVESFVGGEQIGDA